MNILEEYEILSVIGEGTFGVVKLSKNKENGEEVAIKILAKNKIINEDDEERVKREIEILEKVHHINVIKILKIEEDNDNIYLVMEFCEKGELFNHIVEEQKLEEIEAAYYYYQLINGLECIHHNEIVHRDLKPENLLLSKGYILKIIDFGLSNFFNKTKLLSTPCGSPCYASPEMVSGKKYDGFMIDIWSTGIILYAMLCGYLPFEDPDNEILFQKILKCEAEFPEDLSDEAIDLMQKIMVTNPKERITIPEIKKHPFYLKGKGKFESLHPNLVNEVEKDYTKNIEEGKNKENNNLGNRENREKEEKKENISSSDKEFPDIKKENESISKNDVIVVNSNKENVFEKFKEFEEKASNEEKKEEIIITENEKVSDGSNNGNKEENKEEKKDVNDLDVKIKENAEIVNNEKERDIIKDLPNKNIDLNLKKDNDNLNNFEKNKLIIKRDDNIMLEKIKEEDNKNLENKKDIKDIKKEVTKKINNGIDIDNIDKLLQKTRKNKKEIKNKIGVNIEDNNKDININDNIMNNDGKKTEIDNNILEYKKKVKDNNIDIQKIRNKSKEKEKYHKTIDTIEKNEHVINSQRNEENIIPNTKFNNLHIEKEKEKIIKTIVNNNRIKNIIMKEIKPSKDKLIEPNKNKSDIQKKTNANIILNLKNVNNINKQQKIQKNKNLEPIKQNIIPKKSDSLNIKKNEILKEKIMGIKTAKNSNHKNNLVMNHFRLTDNELNSKKENINLNLNSAKIANALKIKTINNPTSELQDRQKRKNIKIPIYINNNENSINLNNKTLDQNKLLYNNNIAIRNNSKNYNNKLSLDIFKLKSNGLFTDSNSIDKINSNMKKIQKMNTFHNNTLNHINNIYSQRTKKISFQNRMKISDTINLKNKKIINPESDFYIKSEYNQKTFNKNLDLNNMNSNLDKFNDYQNLNTLPGNLLYPSVMNKRKLEQKREPINIIVNQNTYKNNNIVYQTRSFNDYAINSRTIDDNINRLKNKDLYNNINVRNIKIDNKLIHKKNISNDLYANAQTNNKIDFYNNNINKTETKLSLNKGRGIINRPIYINNNNVNNNIGKNKNNYHYINSVKEINYSNNGFNINNNSNRRRLNLNINRKNETMDYLATNTNENINSNIKNRKNLNERLLALTSNSAEKIRNYNNRNTINTISDLDSNIKLYTNHGHLNNNIINNRNMQPKINSSLINNISNEYNYQRNGGNKIYYINDMKNKNNNIQYNINNKLVKKGIIQNNSQRPKEYNNNNIFIDDRGNIYDTRTKPNNKYLSNFNVNNNILTNKNYDRYNQFNKTQTDLGEFYNNKINIENIQTKYNNYNYKVTNNKRNNKPNILINDNNIRKKIGQNNNRISVSNNEINNNINFYTDNSMNNKDIAINKHNNQIIQRYSQIINTNNSRRPNKPIVKNNNTNLINNNNTIINYNRFGENALMNHKANKNLDVINMNSYKERANIKLRENNRPISSISQILSNETSQQYLTNNNTDENFHHNKSKNISDFLMSNSIENKAKNRKSLGYAKTGNSNFEANYKQISNNHNIYSRYINDGNKNKNKIFNLYNYKTIIK